MKLGSRTRRERKRCLKIAEDMAEEYRFTLDARRASNEELREQLLAMLVVAESIADRIKGGEK